ncbi:MAG: 16S rRNA (cytosine(967)-C(5))-methyltransferase RsmB [Clostridiales bacterium]|nr:16S rRNA (cytosine(967)-C(5))-methyltransferase RsmB [Clostridiales bacterium]
MTDGRQVAYRALLDWDRQGTFARDSLNRLFAKAELPREERMLASELTYGVLECLRRLDHHLERLCGRSLQRLDPPVRTLLRLGAYQLLCLDRVPAYAAIDQTVRMAARHCARAKGFVNGVLRSLDRQRDSLTLPAGDGDEALAVRHSLDAALVALLREQYGARLPALLEGFSHRPPLHLFPNLTLATAQQVAGETGAQPTETPPVLALAGGEVTALPGFAQGRFFVMGRSAAFAVLAADPRPGETVFDLCAAPGGKSFACACLMGGEGRILAFDLTEAKCAKLREGAGRLRLPCIEVAVGDATRHNPALAGGADLVICDLPCSGLGILAKQPEIRYKRPETFAALPALQAAMLENAAGYVAPGGRLLYSTCTLNRAENEDVVEAFLSGRGDFSPIDLAAAAEQAGLQHLRSGPGVTLLPGPGQDGFFVSLLART